MEIDTDSYKVKLFKTILCYISFLGLGGCNTLLGSSLLDLQIRLQSNFSITSNLIPVRSFGYLVGSALSGLVNRYASNIAVLFMATFVSGLTMAIFPWFFSYWLMYSFVLVAGIAQGLIDVSCNTYVLNLWKADKSLANYVQCLYSSFGIGSIIFPLIGKPFLLPLQDDTSKGDDAAILGDYKSSDVKVQWAFLAITAISTTSSAGFLFFYLRENTKNIKIDDSNDVSDEVKISTWKICSIVLLLGMMASTTFSIPAIISQLSPSFSVKSDLHLDKKTAANMVTIWWMVIIFYRVAYIAATNFISENRLVFISFLAHFIGAVIIAPYAATNIYCNWIGFNLIGIGYAPLFAVALSRVQRVFVITNFLASVFFIIGSAGEAILPSIATRLMNLDPVYLTYFMAALSLGNAFLYVTIIYVSPKLFVKCYMVRLG